MHLHLVLFLFHFLIQVVQIQVVQIQVVHIQVVQIQVLEIQVVRSQVVQIQVVRSQVVQIQVASVPARFSAAAVLGAKNPVAMTAFPPVLCLSREK